jgi:hypothetical protein
MPTNTIPHLPALIPVAPARLRPFFLMMKLAPMKRLELTARAKPFWLSVDIDACGPPSCQAQFSPHPSFFPSPPNPKFFLFFSTLLVPLPSLFRHKIQPETPKVQAPHFSHTQTCRWTRLFQFIKSKPDHSNLHHFLKSITEEDASTKLIECLLTPPLLPLVAIQS